MQSTTFTINSDSVKQNQEKLNKLGAIIIATFPTLQGGVKTGQYGIEFPLSAGTKFRIPKKVSRKQLTKLLGKSAMVRGVNK